MLDDLQLEEHDPTTSRYCAIKNVKEELQESVDIMDCRLDMIEKADNSKVGWSAAFEYERTNGMTKTTNSDKLWFEAEKAVLDNRKKTERTQPFREPPAEAGRYRDQYNRSSDKGNVRSTTSLLF